MRNREKYALYLGLFIHYNNIKTISLWQQKEYKKAIDYATKDIGPNNGDYNHKDYINIRQGQRRAR